jgi:hypothetical protein
MKTKIILAAIIATALSSAAFADNFYFRINGSDPEKSIKPLLVSGNVPAGHFTAGIPFEAAFTATGGKGAYEWDVVGSLPPGLSFANGSITGVPQSSGRFAGLKIVVRDARGKEAETAPFEFIVDAPTANAEMTSAARIRQGATISGTVSSNLPSANWNVSVVANPSNAPLPQISISGGKLTASAPQVSAATTYSITATAAQGGVTAPSGAMTVEVLPLPSFSVTASYSGTLGAALTTATPSVSNNLGAITWSATGTLPPGMIGPSAAGVFLGAPTSEATAAVNLVATDIDGATASRTLTFDITSETVKTVRGTPANLVLTSLFTSAELNSTTPKRVIIPSGTVVWTATSAEAINTGSSWTGSLTLQIDSGGEVQGAPGSGATVQGATGGAGGTAILVMAQGFSVVNNGAIRAGGGGGGYGGTAGNLNTSISEPATGYYANSSNGCIYNSSQVRTTMYFQGATISTSQTQNANMTVSGGYRCTPIQPIVLSSNTSVIGGVSRTTSQTISGGVGGAGGSGQGANKSAGSGTAGSVNTISGVSGHRGGTGGGGGNWGVAGSQGRVGDGSGSAGSAGGAAGYAINGNAAYSGSGVKLGR